MPYRTVDAPSTFVDDPVKGSRFVARVAPVGTPAAADEALGAARSAWPDASHHTYAWRLPDGRSRCSDDGEPGGSAGRPILAQIDGHDVVGLIVVVARWFGGTKLGVGGLVRAYGGCAGRALDRASIVEIVPTRRLVVDHGYDDVGAVQGVVAARSLVVVDTAWAETVRLVVEVRQDDVDEVIDVLRSATSGRASVEPVSEIP